jgi:peptidoglycan hydrolase-like protein with peptidoglycan-binding domain
MQFHRPPRQQETGDLTRMQPIDAVLGRLAGRPGGSTRIASPDSVVQNRISRGPGRSDIAATGTRMPATVWIAVGAILFVLGFAAARWLPDLATGARDGVSKPAPGSSTANSAATGPTLRQPDSDHTATPNPLIPRVIRRSAPPDESASDLPPDSEILPAPVTASEPADTAAAPPLLDLGQAEDARRVQQRLIELGFLFGTADGAWGARSRKALQDFRFANGIGDGDAWDETTQKRLLAAPDAIAANTSDISFIGGWGVDGAHCRESPLTISERRAETHGAACEFHSTQRESLQVWRLQARCSSNGERWNANIRFTLSGSKLTWSSERGTTTYMRCPG